MTLKIFTHRSVWRFENRNKLPKSVPDHVRILQSPALAGLFEAKVLRQRLLERDALKGPTFARNADSIENREHHLFLYLTGRRRL